MRAQSREIAFKIIFSTLYFGESEITKNQVLEEAELNESDNEFALQLVDSFLKNRAELEKMLENNVENYELSRIYKVDLALIYLGMTEILYIGTPIAVVINEVVELAKKYSTENSQKFVNGVLAKVAKD